MEKEFESRHGSDLGEEETSSSGRICESCGARVDADAKRDLDRRATPAAVRIERRGRFWAVYENGELLCLTVYRKGAECISRRIATDDVGAGRERA